jgi:hypothetical protein
MNELSSILIHSSNNGIVHISDKTYEDFVGSFEINQA